MLNKTIQDYGGPFFDAEPVGDPTSELASSKYNRLAEDVAQGTRTDGRVIASFETISAAAPQDGIVEDHDTVWGSGEIHKPLVEKTATGVYTLTWATEYQDGLDETEPVALRFGHGQVAGATFGHVQVTVTSGTVLTVRVFDAAGALTDMGGGALVTVWAR